VPLAPETVEVIRDWLLRRRLIRDATLVSVLAYAGLRPGEALALTWAHVRERTLLVESAVSFGKVEGTKTGRRRTVPLVGPLAQDLSGPMTRSSRQEPTREARDRTRLVVASTPRQSLAPARQSAAAIAGRVC
jgi:integrase